MQFAKIFAFAVPTLVTLAAATPTHQNNAPSNQCNTGSLQCCDSTQSASSPTSSLLGLLSVLGIIVGSLTGEVGVTCSPMTVIGSSDSSCSAQVVCCTNNSFNGIVALGCSHVDLNL